MNIRVMRVEIKPEYIDEFKAASRSALEKTMQEPGIVRFEIIQQKDSPTHFVITEMYHTDAARQEHLHTSYFRVWLESMFHMLAEPMESTQYLPVLTSKYR